MNNFNIFFFKNNNIKYHLISLVVLYLYYFFPLLFTGSLLTHVHDNLDSTITYNYVAGKIILGDLEAVKVFLGGELPWQFLKGVFYPITLIYSISDVEKSYWITDVFIKTLAYFSFFYLLKKLNKKTSFTTYLLSLLFASSIVYTVSGMGLATIPYLSGLLLKTKKFKFKNYFAIIFIGLNSDLYIHGIYIIPILFFLFFVFKLKYENKLFNNLIQIIFLYIFAIFISNLPLIYSAIYLRPFHSEEIIRQIPYFKENFLSIFYNLYGATNPYFFKNIFFIILFIIIYFISFIKKYKINIYILSFILITSGLNFFLNIEFINDLRSMSGLLSATNFNRFNQFYYFFYSICLFFIFQEAQFKIKNLTVILIILSILYNLTSTNIKTVFATLFNYYNLKQEYKLVVQSNFKNYEFIKLFKNLSKFDQTELSNEDNEIKSSTSSSIKSYYQFKNYEFIKNIVKENKLLSIGLDPLIPVLSDINVVDGYYYLYPLFYKKKFEKIISAYLGISTIEERENFYNWAHRLQINTYDQNLINFDAVKNIGANFILTDDLIKSNSLTLVCRDCNNYKNFNLYKIN